MLMVFGGGYVGRVAHVDLETGRVEYEGFDEELALDYIGGRGFGMHELFQSKPVSALSIDSMFGMFAGPITGAGVPLANRLTMVFRSPLGGAVAYANTGGYAGAALKCAGLDGVVLTGNCDIPSYLLITPSSVSLENAKTLWGMVASETLHALRAKHGECRVLSIGPAGESLVKYANIVNDAGRASGVRQGAGCVLGAKRIKAIVISSGYTQSVKVADRARFLELLRRLNTKIKGSPLLNRSNGLFALYGTPLAVNPLALNSALPCLNYTRTEVQGAERLSGESMSKSILISRLTCNSCSVQCRRETAGSGHYKFRVEGPDFAQISSLGSNCGLTDLEAVGYLNYLCYELGLDPVETGNMLAAFAEATEKGYVPQDAGLLWADTERMVELVRLIAKKQGIGALLAQGADALARHFADDLLSVAVKGITVQNADPRVEYAWALLNATENSGGAVHIWVYPELITSFYSLQGIRPVLRGHETDLDEIANTVKVKQDLVATLDSLQVCAFSSMAYDLDDYRDAFSYITGLEISTEELLRAGERIFNLERLCNLRYGIVEDELPKKFSEQAIVSGKHAGRVLPIKELLYPYYRVRGWVGARPSPSKLTELGLQSGG